MYDYFCGPKAFFRLLYCEQNGGRNNLQNILGDAVRHAHSDVIFNCATPSRYFSLYREVEDAIDSLSRRGESLTPNVV